MAPSPEGRVAARPDPLHNIRNKPDCQHKSAYLDAFPEELFVAEMLDDARQKPFLDDQNGGRIDCGCQ